MYKGRGGERKEGDVLLITKRERERERKRELEGLPACLHGALILTKGLNAW